MPHEIETMTYFGQLPWHGLGTALAVEDDSPEGFKDLSHAYTLFAESYKRANPEQRGQYNFGEKLMLAVCEIASISTTRGTVVFTDEGRLEQPRQKRERGSVFQGRIRMTREHDDTPGYYAGYCIMIATPKNCLVVHLAHELSVLMINRKRHSFPCFRIGNTASPW